MIHPQPQPQPLIRDRIADKKQLALKSAAFRKAVWERDASCCRFCGRRVRKTFEAIAERGEVHHKRGRNVAPADRYNPKAAVLLCLLCHADPDVIAFYRRQATP